jgi:polar amino acid transport system substrate-binding protein
VNAARRPHPLAVAVCAALALAGALACTSGRERLADPAVPTTTAAPAAAPGCDAPVEENVRSYNPLPATAKGEAAAQTIRKNALVVGVSADTKLMGFRDPATGMLGGFEVDLLREVARELFDDPAKIELQVLSFADRIPALQNNRVDVVAETMTVNCTRWQAVNFSTEYLRAGQRLLVRSDAAGVKGLADLGGQKVCATRGGTSLDNLRRNFPQVVPEPVGVVTDCMVLFQQGKVAAIVSDDVILAGFQAQDPFARVILEGDRLTQEPYGMGIKAENTTLTGYVNGVLDRMRADGRWQKIYNQWLAGSLGAQNPPAAAYGRAPR